ncbi:MAG: filamentous hemagglutinin N-terminal domain-containing protein [Nostoc sp.]|uniref:two-partner secretion domain-containing protein n=1 Tax=Nostoc sp. TaxID=1180 RepID=UPI002FF4CF67
MAKIQPENIVRGDLSDRSNIFKLWQIGIMVAATSGAILPGNSAIAQIVPDNTLGAEKTVVTPNVDIKGVLSDRIDGGAIRSTNLFHSFLEFNVREGRGAYFNNPAGIESIFSRVTGNNASNIYGKLGVLGNANLFLLNPNGIIFGPNASLDIKGSFVGSTANSLNFGGGKEFSATNPTAPPLLTVAVPLGVQFNQQQPSAIANSGNLSVGTGQNLTLLGGTVVSTGQLSAPGGQVSVAAVPGSSVVNLNSSAQLLNIDTSSIGTGEGSSSLTELFANRDQRSYPGLTLNNNGQVELAGSGLPVVDGDVVAKNVTAQTATLTAHHNLTLVESQIGTTGDLNLLAGDTVRVRDSVANPFVAQAGGKLLVQGRQRVDIFALNNPNSGLFSGGDLVLRSANTVGGDAHYWAGGNFRIEQLDGSPGNLFSPYDPIVLANGNVTLADYTGASLHILAGGSVNLGNVTINALDSTANTINPTNPTSTPNLATVTLLDGTSLTINGSTQPTLDVRSGIDWTQLGGLPKNQVIGTVNPLPQFDLPLTVTTADISIATVTSNSPNSLVFLTNRYNRNATALPNGSITIGNINAVVTIDDNNAGNVIVDALGDIKTTGFINTFVPAGQNGNAGNIRLFSEKGLIDTTRGTLNASTGTGSGGNVTLIADKDISTAEIKTFSTSGNSRDISITSLNGSINTTADKLISSTDKGSAGNITLNAQAGGISIGEIETFANQGTAGNVDIDAFGDVNVNRSITAISKSDSSDFRKININSSQGKVSLSNAGLSTTNTGSGFAGDIRITGKNIEINQSNIESKGVVGRIFIGTPNTESVTTRNSTVNIETLPGVTTTFEPTQGEGIDIQGRVIQILDSILTAKTQSTAPPSSISVNATGPLTLTNSSINSRVDNASAGSQIVQDYTPIVSMKGSNVTLTNITVDASTIGLGKAADVSITARDGGNVAITNSYLRTSTKTNSSTSTAGNISVIGGSEISLNRSILDASTFGAANGGNIFLENRSGSIKLLGGSSIFTSVETKNTSGNGGILNIKADSLTIENSIAKASSDGLGRAGNVLVDARFVLLRGTNPSTNFRDLPNGTITTGLLAEATQVNGSAGDLRITTDELRIENGAAATVSSPRGQAGNLKIYAHKIFLDNGGLFATTGLEGSQAVGANIFLLGKETNRDEAEKNLQLQINAGKLRGESLPGSPLNFLLLRNGSLIEANANNFAKGGNIAINTQLLLALPPNKNDDNDISANAKQGTGGLVAIKATPLGVYGIEFRKQQTDLNDITANSESGLAGIVSLGLPDVDPSRGLIQLPENLGDSSKLIAQSCPVGGQRATSQFVVTGRGGLPPNPGSALSSGALVGNAGEQSSLTSSSPTPTVEAQGVNIGPKGEIILTANPSKLASYSSWQRFTGCNEK